VRYRLNVYDNKKTRALPYNERFFAGTAIPPTRNDIDPPRIDDAHNERTAKRLRIKIINPPTGAQ